MSRALCVLHVAVVWSLFQTGPIGVLGQGGFGLDRAVVPTAPAQLITHPISKLALLTPTNVVTIASSPFGSGLVTLSNPWDSYSYAFWIMMLTTKPDFTTVFRNGNTDGQRAPAVYVYPNIYRLHIRVTLDGQDWGIDPPALTPNVWTHVAFIVTSTSMAVYVNGQLIESGDMPSARSFFGNQTFFVGGVDDQNYGSASCILAHLTYFPSDIGTCGVQRDMAGFNFAATMGPIVSAAQQQATSAGGLRASFFKSLARMPASLDPTDSFWTTAQPEWVSVQTPFFDLPSPSTILPGTQDQLLVPSSPPLNAANILSLYEGLLFAPATEAYTFYLVADDVAKILIDGQGVSSGGQVSLAKGYHALQIYYLQSTGLASLKLSWAFGSVGAQLIAPPYFSRNLTQSHGWRVGFNALSMDENGDAVLPFGDPCMPIFETVVNMINFHPNSTLGNASKRAWPRDVVTDGGLGDDFTATFRTNLFVGVNGTYTFSLAADDGAQLSLTDATAVPEIILPMAHNQPNRTTSVWLARGWYRAQLDYYDYASSHDLALFWTGPSLPATFSLIPASATDPARTTAPSGLLRLVCVPNVTYFTVAVDSGVRLCTPVTVCAPGTFVAAAPSILADRVCLPCVKGANFSEFSNSEVCVNVSSPCLSRGLATLVEPTLSSDRLCGAKLPAGNTTTVSTTAASSIRSTLAITSSSSSSSSSSARSTGASTTASTSRSATIVSTTMRASDSATYSASTPATTAVAAVAQRSAGSDPAGLIAGIICGAACLIILVVLVVWGVRRNRARRSVKHFTGPDSIAMQANPMYEPGRGPAAQADTQTRLANPLYQSGGGAVPSSLPPSHHQPNPMYGASSQAMMPRVAPRAANSQAPPTAEYEIAGLSADVLNKPPAPPAAQQYASVLTTESARENAYTLPPPRAAAPLSSTEGTLVAAGLNSKKAANPYHSVVTLSASRSRP